jgi:hypothetical protein
MSSTIPPVADAMRHMLTDVAHEAATKSGFIKRQRKLDGASFVQTLVFGWLANPKASAEERAQVAASRGVKVSAYGLDKRLDERGAECLRLVLEAAIERAVLAADPTAVPILQRFSGVYVYDGSVVSLPEALREEWPGLGGNGPDVGAAALKIGVRLDLLSGELYGPVLGAGREHDRKLPLKAQALPAGALRLADLGFFDLKLFRSVGEQGGYWLSRLKGATVVYEATNPTADRLDLSTFLGEKLAAPGDTLELEVLVGDQARLPARLLATRVPRVVADERRRKLRLDAKRRQQPAVSEARLALAEYTLLITDAPTDLLTAEEAFVLMRARWQVEKLFDLWKRYGGLKESRSKKPWRVLCEVYAKLLGLLVQHWVFLSSTAFWADPYRSLVKAGRTVRQRALSLADTLDEPALLTRVLKSIGRCLAAGCRVAKRRKEPGTAQQLLALTDAGEEGAIA